MRNKKCNLDIVIYNTLFDVLCRNGSKMHISCGIGTSKTSPGVVPNVVAYATMIHDFC